MAAAKPSGRSRLKRFVVAEGSMLPALSPGDGLIAWRDGAAKVGQVRIFQHPQRPGFWLVKRVGAVRGTQFTAVSDNTSAPGVVDSRSFGDVETAGSYRMLLRLRGRATQDTAAHSPDASLD